MASAATYLFSAKANIRRSLNQPDANLNQSVITVAAHAAPWPVQAPIPETAENLSHTGPTQPFALA